MQKPPILHRRPTPPQLTFFQLVCPRLLSFLCARPWLQRLQRRSCLRRLDIPLRRFLHPIPPQDQLGTPTPISYPQAQVECALELLHSLPPPTVIRSPLHRLEVQWDYFCPALAAPTLHYQPHYPPGCLGAGIPQRVRQDLLLQGLESVPAAKVHMGYPEATRHVCPTLHPRLARPTLQLYPARPRRI